ncbi:MAG: TonB-dependent receptor domain-containing protein [Phenylobacterium sp.]|jgi:TonB-dependent receptor
MTRTLRTVLLAGAALTTAHAAFAQTPPPPGGTEVEEIIVSGRFIPDVVRDTAEVANFLSVEDVQRAGDDNAAQALTRITGISLVSGRFVYVRGLGERYSQALLNGSPLPSPEPLQRVIPLDLFPASILAGTVIQKTFSANYPGEFGGGVIDLQTVGAPDETFVRIGVGAGGDTETTGKRGLTYFGSDTDWLGFDDGARKLPVGIRAFALDKPLVAGTPGLSNDQYKAAARSFNNAPLNLQQRARTPANGNFDVSAGHAIDTPNGTVGGIGVVSYRNSWLTRKGVRQTTAPDLGGLALATDAVFEANQNDVGWSGLGGLTWEDGDNEVRYTGLWIRTTSKRARITQNSAQSQGNANVNAYGTEWYERELQLNQLSGKHLLADWELEWRGTYGRTARQAPYERLYRYGLGADGKRTALLSGANQLLSFSDLDENIGSANLDLSYDLPVEFVRQAQLKVGAAWQRNSRTSWRRDFTYDQGRNWDPARYAGQRIDYLVADRNLNDDIVALRELTGSALTGDSALFDAELEVAGAYVQVDSEIRPLLRGSLGLRYETADQIVRTLDIFKPTAPPLFSRSVSKDYVLPAATLTWNFAEDQQLRFGVSKTIGRPQFRELAPQRYRDTDTDRILTGNPYLEDTTFLNLDARYERYFANGQYFTLGAFLKDMEKPVEALAILGSDGAFRQTFYNAPAAQIIGAEVEFKRVFDFQTGSSWIDDRRWLVALNYTYTKSELRVSDGDTIVLDTTGVRTTPPAKDYLRGGEKLQGQSDHLANLQLGFENEEAGSQATLLVTYTSERVAARSSSIDLPDLIQNPGLRLDFVFRKTFEANGQEFTGSFEARNLTGTDAEEYQEAGGKRFETNSFTVGQSFSVGLSTRF